MPDQIRQWEFLEQPEKMGMATNLFVKTLSQSDFTNEAILAREALQNCKDARPKDSTLPAQVTIKKRDLDGQAVKKMSELLNLGECADRAEHLSDQGRREDFAQLLNGEVPLSTLEIADENTIGLGGRWDGNTEHDHFSRLVINLGASLKEEGGGSFGFGKTVFAKQSKLNLVIYYSVFEPTDDTDQAHARLMAVWLMKPHNYNGKKQTGFAFLGQPNPENKDTVQPFIDDDAHKIAEDLGITRRSPDNLGTTVMVIDCDPSMKEIAESVERYWWPSIHDKALSIRVLDNDALISVKPSKNPCVAPYLTAYRGLQTDRPSGQDTKTYANGTKAREFRRLGHRKLGWLAMQTLTELEAKLWKEHESERSDDESIQVGGVARMRPGSGMIISYQAEATSQSRPCIALFQSAEVIEQFLRISEPPTHDRWNSGEPRLNDPEHFKDKDFEPDLGRKIVSAVNNRITNQLRDFQKDEPDPAPPPEYKLKALESLLAKLMNAGNQEKAVPPGPPKPFSVSVIPKRRESKGILKDEADIKVKLNDDYPNDSLDIKLDITRDLIGVQSSERPVGRLNCTVVDQESGESINGEFVEFSLTLKKGEVVKLHATGDGYTNFKTRYCVVAKKPN